MAEIDKLKPVFMRFDDPMVAVALHRNQIRTLNVLRGHSRVLSDEARSKLLARVRHLGFDEAVLDAVVKYIAKEAPLCINFKPETVLDKFLGDDCYRNLFEIGTGGGCTDQKTRAGWEKERFMSLYEGAVAFERPKYGSMNVVSDPGGNRTVRGYGPAYMTLRPHVRIRTTMACGDTSTAATMGTPDYAQHVMLKFSENELKSCCEIVTNRIPHGYFQSETYRECQYHGEIRFDRDIASVVLPDTYKGSVYEKKAVEFAVKSGCVFEWYDAKK